MLDNWLFICGGHIYGASSPLSDCYKFDLDGYNANWVASTGLPRRRRHFVMITYGSSIFMSGGYDYWSGNITI